jgi:hypothetical protein
MPADIERVRSRYASTDGSVLPRCYHGYFALKTLLLGVTRPESRRRPTQF